MPDPSLVNALARSFLAGTQTVEQIVARGHRMLGRRWRWLRPLAKRYIAAVDGRTRPRHRSVVRFLLQDEGFKRAWTKHGSKMEVRERLTGEQQMHPAAVARKWRLPAIGSVGALADWLHLSPGELEWFADLKGLGYKNTGPHLRHYHYQLRVKSSGDLRLIEAPKSRLKEIQRKILISILNKVPPHPAAHGFIARRSIKTFVAPHAGQRVVLRMDLRNFFPAFTAARIQAFFRMLGYPESVADRLGGICTNVAPREVWTRHSFGVGPDRLREIREVYGRPHLPQGSPSSPALANSCAYRLDCRLSGLAGSAGAVYTRYADDLAFSGGPAFERCVERFSTHVAAILREEGFVAHHRKTRIMRQGVRQHLAGLVANHHVNIIRSDFDRLKAILTNCSRLGPAGQNRDAHPDFRSHLEGRVGFVEMINPEKGKRLRAIFEKIQWQ